MGCSSSLPLGGCIPPEEIPSDEIHPKRFCSDELFATGDLGQGSAPARHGCPLGARQKARAVSQSFSADVAVCVRCLAEQGHSVEDVATLMKLDVNDVREAIQFDRYAQAARTLHKCNVLISDIAEQLNMSEASVMMAVHRTGSCIAGVAMAGRLLHNEIQECLDKFLNEDSELCCPVTMVLLREPVIASDGFVYESDSVKTLIMSNMPSPMTREPLEKQFLPAKQTKSACHTFRQNRSRELLDLATRVITEEPRMAITALHRATEYIEFLQPQNVPQLTCTAIELWRQSGRPVPIELRC